MRPFLTTWLFVLVALTNFSVVGQPSSFLSPPEPISVDAYWKLVSDTLQVVQNLGTRPEAEIRMSLDKLAAQWEQVQAVRLSTQDVIHFNSTALIAELRNPAPDILRLQKLLEALLQMHTEDPGAIFTLQDVQLVQDILAHPEFQWVEPRVVDTPDWLQKIFDIIDGVRDQLFLFGLNMLMYGRIPLTIAAVAIFLISIYFIARSLERNLVRDVELAVGDNAELLLSSTGAMKQAQALSIQGDYRTAIRYLYLSSLLTLDEQGFLRYDRSRTNREYLSSVAARPSLVAALQNVIELFDRVWYGFEDVDERTYQAYVLQVEQLREHQK